MLQKLLNTTENVMSKSATKAALEYMEKTGCTAYAAALKFGITPATVYAATNKPRCPHCGNYLKSQNTTVLTEPAAPADNLLDV